MRMAWWFYRLYQIWSHSLGVMLLGWKASQCIDCIPGLSELVHAPITCGMGDNWTMTTCTLYHIKHLHGDWLVGFRSYKILAHSFGGLWPGYRGCTCVGYTPGVWDLFHASMKHVKRVATHIWQLVPRITSHTSLGMAWWFVDTATPWLTALMVYCLDGGYPHVYDTSQDCETFPMHPQNMWNLFPPIHDHW